MHLGEPAVPVLVKGLTMAGFRAFGITSLKHDFNVEGGLGGSGLVATAREPNEIHGCANMHCGWPFRLDAAKTVDAIEVMAKDQNSIDSEGRRVRGSVCQREDGGTGSDRVDCR
mgnify:CR=1 FL=1